MNSILVCLSVFNLGSLLAVKIPKNVDEGGMPDVNEESLEKQSVDPSSSQYEASLITKREVGTEHSTGLILQFLLLKIQNKAIFVSYYHLLFCFAKRR